MSNQHLANPNPWPIRAYIGIGSNLNNPVQQVRAAIAALKKLPQSKFIMASSLYQTKPVGPQDQPDFINAVAALDTQLSPHKLLQTLKKIERIQGRVKTRHWGERVIDLDILLYGDRIIKTKSLTIPHPEMRKRDFVLLPLAEIAPNLMLSKVSQIKS